jgi:hypothetical protein
MLPWRIRIQANIHETWFQSFKLIEDKSIDVLILVSEHWGFAN